MFTEEETRIFKWIKINVFVFVGTVTPQTTPQVTSQATPQVTPQATPQVTPELVPQVTPRVTSGKLITSG